MRKALITILVSMSCLCLVVAAAAQAEKKAAPPVGKAAARPVRANFAMLFGSISKIDTQDPAKPALEIKSGTDNSIHRVEMTPATSITKFTDISELKTGDEVRVMTRKIDGKEVAMGVMFGKIRNLPIARPAAAAPAKPAVRSPKR